MENTYHKEVRLKQLAVSELLSRVPLETALDTFMKGSGETHLFSISYESGSYISFVANAEANKASISCFFGDYSKSIEFVASEGSSDNPCSAFIAAWRNLRNILD